MYALNLDETNRILSITFEQYASPDNPIVETIPTDRVSDTATSQELDVHNYLYINGEYIYDPLPEPEEIAIENTNTLEERVEQNEANIEFLAMMTGVDMEV